MPGRCCECCRLRTDVWRHVEIRHRLTADLFVILDCAVRRRVCHDDCSLGLRRAAFRTGLPGSGWSLPAGRPADVFAGHAEGIETLAGTIGSDRPDGRGSMGLWADTES